MVSVREHYLSSGLPRREGPETFLGLFEGQFEPDLRGDPGVRDEGQEVGQLGPRAHRRADDLQLEEEQSLQVGTGIRPARRPRFRTLRPRAPAAAPRWDTWRARRVCSRAPASPLCVLSPTPADRRRARAGSAPSTRRLTHLGRAWSAPAADRT